MLNDEGQIIEQRYPRWWDKWVNPTTLFALIGGIIWGVQLNLYVMKTAEDVASIRGVQDTMLANAKESELNMTKQTIILDNLLTRIDNLEEIVTDHNKEAEVWKRRIIQNGLIRDPDFGNMGVP